MLAYGDFGLRVLEGTRLSAKQLQTSEDAIKKAIKPVKGAKTCVVLLNFHEKDRS